MCVCINTHSFVYNIYYISKDHNVENELQKKMQMQLFPGECVIHDP